MAPALAGQLRFSEPADGADERGRPEGGRRFDSGEIVPIVAGLRGPSNDWILVPAARHRADRHHDGLVSSRYGGDRRRRSFTCSFWSCRLCSSPAVAFTIRSRIATSSRYAALAVVVAIGAEEIGRWNTLAGVAALATLLVMGAVEQATWYSRLPPETRSGPIIECLTQHGLRGAMADYWLSYKLTFLSGESLILAPSNGVDRLSAAHVFCPVTRTRRLRPTLPFASVTMKTPREDLDSVRARGACRVSRARARGALAYFHSGQTLSIKEHHLDGQSLVLTLRSGGQIICEASVIARFAPDEVPYPEPEPEPKPVVVAQALPVVPLRRTDRQGRGRSRRAGQTRSSRHPGPSPLTSHAPDRPKAPWA